MYSFLKKEYVYLFGLRRVLVVARRSFSLGHADPLVVVLGPWSVRAQQLGAGLVALQHAGS